MTRTQPHRWGDRVGVPAVVPISKTPAIKAIDVPCPDCASPAGTTCMMADGSFRPTHPARRRMAVRKVNSERQESPADFGATLEQWQRQQIRMDANLTLADLAGLFGVSDSTIFTLEKGTRRAKDDLAAAYGAWLKLRAGIR